MGRDYVWIHWNRRGKQLYNLSWSVSLRITLFVRWSYKQYTGGIAQFTLRTTTREMNTAFVTEVAANNKRTTRISHMWERSLICIRCFRASIHMKFSFFSYISFISLVLLFSWYSGIHNFSTFTASFLLSVRFRLSFFFYIFFFIFYCHHKLKCNFKAVVLISDF